ncbi:MAG: ABC transporter ATP-binding protein [Verrucomicrobiales bacterium]|jgi:ABC-type Fe3+/spermidine/putrescine transport system ATPase subunit|nr:ABC transporter ATP-binding protein [Verrucomicrobiales bacterium]
MNITIQNLTKSFGETRALDHLSLTVNSGEMFFLLGPSGCGKTTLLRALAGFVEPDAGDILFGGKSILSVPPHARNTALVFQNYAVWPHLTVFENVAYGLRVRHVAAADLRRRVTAALRQVGMEALARRKPVTLSGGQLQRTALARAIVVEPDVLLFDEPLSNLDAQLRLEIRAEIKRLHAAFQRTSIYVTHDQHEALTLADRIAVLRDGRIQQLGTPREIYDHPATPFVAAFIGEINLFAAAAPLAKNLAVSGRQFGFRPEKVELTAGDGIPARVTDSAYLGASTELLLETAAGEKIKARVPRPAAVGDTVRFTVSRENILEFAQ